MSCMEKAILTDTKKKETGEKVLNLISNKLTKFGNIATNPAEPIFVAYILFKASLKPYVTPDFQSIAKGKVISADLVLPFLETYNEISWNHIYSELINIPAEELALAVFSDFCSYTMNKCYVDVTPESIIKLASQILDIKAADNVADFCSGHGNFTNDSILQQPNAEYTEYEIDIDKTLIAKLRMDILESTAKILSQDVFSLEKDVNYDKVFSHYPFGLKHRMAGYGKIYVEELRVKHPAIFKTASSDWIFNFLMCEHLNSEGKAVGIMTNGSAWSTLDKPVRKFFVERGLVEAVISLPERMFVSYNIPVTMIVLSHGNERVRMIDATQICHQGRRYNELRNNDIEKIIEAMHTDSEISKEIDLEQLRKNDYSLSLSRYVTNVRSFKNSMRLKDVTKEIIRGASCSANILDGITTEKVTNMQYLKLANIQDGVIDDNLPYLSEIDSKYIKNCLENNDLVLSKNGYPIKIAVAEIEEGQKILANGNLYIIRLDLTKINPYYLKAFFESETGKSLLKSITGVSSIPNISTSALKEITIPVPSMEVQDNVARKYKGLLSEIDVLKTKLEKAQNKLYEVWDEEGVE